MTIERSDAGDLQNTQRHAIARPAPYLGGKFIATHSARHEDVGKQQAYARIPLDRGYGLRASACRASDVSKSFGELGGEFAQFIVVLHDQNLGVADTIRSDHFQVLQNDGFRPLDLPTLAGGLSS